MRGAAGSIALAAVVAGTATNAVAAPVPSPSHDLDAQHLEPGAHADDDHPEDDAVDQHPHPAERPAAHRLPHRG